MEVEEHETGDNRTAGTGFDDVRGGLTQQEAGDTREAWGSVSTQEGGNEWIGSIGFYIKRDIIVIQTGNFSSSEWN